MVTLLRNGSYTADPRLDRLPSATTEHLDRFPLTAATIPGKPSPMLAGINWYENFDAPERITVHDDNGRARRFWAIGRGDLGRIRGGHAFSTKPLDIVDPYSWWDYYNQGVEGRCVEFGVLRMMSLLNRKRYDLTSRWLYWTAQQIDEWEGGSYPGGSPSYEGTSGRAGLDVALKYGLLLPERTRTGYRQIPFEEAGELVSPQEGIAAYRWAPDWATVRTVNGVPDWCPGVPFVNSWGRDGYPHMTILLDEAGERVHREDGEWGVVTDR